MKRIWFISIALLGMFFFMPSNVLSKSKKDSLVINRVFRYKDNYASEIAGFTDNIYLKYSFQTKRRNPTLFLIPTMYTIAKGLRNNIGETYGKITFDDFNKYNIRRQVVIGSLSSHYKTMPILLDYIIPSLYDASLFDEHILSPFHKNNRKFYRYRTKLISDKLAYISFQPRTQSTQLINGSAIVDKTTGRIDKANFHGEYDMIKFDITTDMASDRTTPHFLPHLCNTKATFNFLGNHIAANFMLVLGCKDTLPDSISNSSNIHLMDSIRPYPLSKFELDIYREKQAKKNDTTGIRETNSKIKEIAWDIIGDHMLNSMGAKSSKASIKLSPLLNPLYMSYSHNRGLAYKIKIGAEYNFSQNQNLSFSPQLGYNFKIKKMFFNIPFRYNYNKRRNAWVEFTWKNGNRITDSSVLDIIKKENKDSVDFSSFNLDYFDDEIYQLKNNISITKILDFTVGIVYHKRIAVNKKEFNLLGKPNEYRSFAPQLTIGFHPFKSGPVFTANYERGLQDIIKSNIEYERWEFDMSLKKKLSRLRCYNIRTGGGFYTNKSSNYFVDFANFSENYLPDGWDDDWSGNFQLLKSQWYNASRYYMRTNLSYESPLLMMTWGPFIGKYIETERIYLSALQLEHIQPYFEIGYGLTNRYFSVGLFCNIVDGKCYAFGSKFTFELFRKW